MTNGWRDGAEGREVPKAMPDHLDDMPRDLPAAPKREPPRWTREQYEAAVHIAAKVIDEAEDSMRNITKDDFCKNIEEHVRITIEMDAGCRRLLADAGITDDEDVWRLSVAMWRNIEDLVPHLRKLIATPLSDRNDVVPLVLQDIERLIFAEWVGGVINETDYRRRLHELAVVKMR